LGRDEVLVLVEKRNFVAISYRNFLATSLALEAIGRHEPASLFDSHVAAIFTFKGEVDLTQPKRK
jgi:hypothetical protein